MLAALVRSYLKYSPFDRGKWRLWELTLPLLNGRQQIEQRFRTKDGFVMELHRSEFIDNFIYNWGCWEPDEVWLLRSLLKPGDTFVDVGANVGYFSLAASQLVGSAGHVFAFEPVPATIKRLATNLALNGISNVTIVPFACSDRRGPVTLSGISPQNPGAQTMRSVGAACDMWSVKAVRLDEQLPDDRDYALVKMDIEGAESLALSGLTRHFEARRIHAVMCEITEEFLQSLGSSTEQVFDKMAAHGFTAYKCRNKRLRKIAAKEAARTQTNVLFQL